MVRFVSILFCLTQICTYTLAQSPNQPKLFQSDEPLSIRLGYSFKEIAKNTSDSVYLPAVLYYSSDKQTWDSVRVGVRGRGHFRRDKCFFTPIRIKIEKDDIKGTPFQGNRNLKLVLPCKTGSKYDDLVLREYLCYQMYEPLTPYTFNTRLLNASIRDLGSKQVKTYEVKAFLLEDDDAAAKRYHGKAVDENLHPRLINDTSSLRHDLFEYMIANTDWSSAYQHNSKLIKIGSKYVPVAYDFDMAGFVNAPYSEVSPTLQIKSVRERLYRGYCRDENVGQYVRKDFISSMPLVFDALTRHEGAFDAKEFSSMKKFIQEFFDILNDDKSFRNNVLGVCRTE